MTKRQGTDSERRGVRNYSAARCTPNSGALWFAKGDFISKNNMCGYDGIMFENKHTGKKSYSLKLDTLKKHDVEALSENCIPAFRVEYDKEAFIILPEWVFQQLLKCAQGDEDGRPGESR
jgi:hypothetical protein